MRPRGPYDEEEAFERLKFAYVEKGVRQFEALLAAKGRKPDKKTVETVRKLLESQPGTDEQVRGELQHLAGMVRREGLLDAGAVLLWGVSGSLVAALIWEHRALVCGFLAAALVGAAALQFRGALTRYLPGWRAVAVVLVVITALVAFLYRENLVAFGSGEGAPDAGSVSGDGGGLAAGGDGGPALK